jgi:uncharacterized protein (TIGR03067 family)
VKTRLLAVLAVVLAIAADDPKGDAVKAEMKKLEGTWKEVSFVVDGKKVPDDEGSTVTFIMKADGTWNMKVGKEDSNGTFTIDPSKKPKTAAFVVLSGKYKGKTTLDIYELDGDTLKFCFVMVDTGKETTKERPSRFSSESGSGHSLSVLQRVKSK